MRAGIAFLNQFAIPIGESKSNLRVSSLNVALQIALARVRHPAHDLDSTLTTMLQRLDGVSRYVRKGLLY
jgi:hypothetical protein